MPDARTMHSPYPPGQGAASVPVLFTLPNVQPVIAAASVKPEGLARTASPATELEGVGTAPNVSLNTPAASASDSLNPALAGVYGKKSPGSGSKVGHVTNAVIGVLLLAVVSLTIRNFAPANSKSAPSATNPPSSDATAKLTQSTAVVLSPSPNIDAQSETASVSAGTKPIPPVAPGVLSGNAAVLVASKSDGIRKTDAASSRSRDSDASADAIASFAEKNQESSLPNDSLEGSVDDRAAGSEENLAGSTTGVPAVPLLLPSKEPKTALGGNATLQHPQPTVDASVVPPGASKGPYGTTAANPSATIPADSGPVAGNAVAGNAVAGDAVVGNSASSNQGKGNVSLTSSPNRYAGNSAVGIPNAVDSDTPSLNTRDMINLRNGQRSAKGIVGGTTTVRNPAARGQEAMNPTQSMLMSGETYPPIRKQYEPINIPSNGTQAPSAYQPVYQPALPPNAAVQPGVATGQGGAASSNVIAQPRVPYPSSSPAFGNPAATAPSNATQQRPLQPYTPLTPTLPIPDGNGLAPATPNR